MQPSESDQRRRLRASGVPLDFSGPIAAFAVGPRIDTGKPLHIIPRESWAAEVAASAAEESEFWKGRPVCIELMVELPFWLLIPDSNISIAYRDSSAVASVKGNWAEVSAGNGFYDSHRTVVYLGPADTLQSGELPATVVGLEMPIYRHMRTVIIFQTTAQEDAVLALRDPDPIVQQEPHKLRRLGRAIQYLQSLAYGHIPLLNKLITSYRVASGDPFAFQVSQWDVPVWFAKHGESFLRISLMPYFDDDGYPTLTGFDDNDRSPFYAASSEAVEAQKDADAPAGTLEILNARSLLCRGHADDAVRSAVTAIEVAVEAKIIELLTERGWNEQQIQGRLGETRNDFDARIADYERTSGTRIPGPVLSCLPYVNGIRLKSELRQVRSLRHKIVHEGLRVDSHSRGPMVRAIETMTWLFEWLSWDKGAAEGNPKGYVYFEMKRGMHVPRYAIEYCVSGVTVLADEARGEQVLHAEELVWSQYLGTLDRETTDIELFALMSLAYLGLDARDAPFPTGNAHAHERFHVSYGDHYAIVFCLECDGLIDSRTMDVVAVRLREWETQHDTTCSALCIINHQIDRAIGRREVERAIPDDVNRIARQYGVTLITAVDLRFLVEGAREYKWNMAAIKDLMFLPGRQGMMPPAYRQVGACVHFYGQHSVMSVELLPGETLPTGGTLGIRLPTRYHEERIESIQVDHRSVDCATGPGKAGVQTTLNRSDVRVGQAVFRRDV